MTEKELMLSEQLYIANDPELGEDNRKAMRLTHLINTASGEDREQIQGECSGRVWSFEGTVGCSWIGYREGR